MSAAAAGALHSAYRAAGALPSVLFGPHGGRRWCAAAAGSARLPTSSAAPAQVPTPGTVAVHFVDPNCEGPPRRQTVRVPVGWSIVDAAKAHGVDIHAACGQKLQCATCHVILKQQMYEQLQQPGVRENDLLDSTYTLTSTSRLGCQVKLSEDMDGIECTLPDSCAKGLTRMSMEQERSRVDRQWTDVPAVPPAYRRREGPMVKAAPLGVPLNSFINGASDGPSGLGGIETTNGADGSHGVARTGPEAAAGFQQTQESLQQQLEVQRNISARLESELRQLRARAAAAEVAIGNSKRPRAPTANANSATESGEDKDGGEEEASLAKVKAELEHTRVNMDALGRRVTFKDVIGLDQAKRALQEAVLWPAMADPALFAGVRGCPRGLLLYGPPGCGKTMLARAACAELGEQATFFHVRPGDVMSKFYGDSQRRIQALEELAREAAPAVVFFDEVDSLLGSRDGGGAAEHHRATTNALLAWMDGFGTGAERVFFLGATNRAEAIDEAALRRFGEAAEVGVPSVDSRLALLKHLVFNTATVDGHRTAVTEADLQAMAERTEGFSLADVDGLVRRAFLGVLRELPAPGIRPGLGPADVPPVTLKHFETALVEGGSTSALREMLQKRALTRKSL